MRKLLAVVLVASWPALARAQETTEATAMPIAPPAAPAAVAPAVELEQLGSFVGSWRCEGQFQASLSATEKTPSVSTVEIKPALQGFWLSGRAVREKAKGPALLAEERLFYWSYDAVVRQFVGGWLDSRGAWSTQTSFGWNSDEITMFGHTTAEGQKLTAREIFTRPATLSFTRRYEVLLGDRWTRLGEETCRAIPPKRGRR